MAGAALRQRPPLRRIEWDFKISGEVAAPLKLSWKEFRAVPQIEVTSDFHCVTRWSRLNNNLERRPVHRSPEAGQTEVRR